MLPMRPNRGGYSRPFGCGWFIREFLLGHGPEGSAVIDPDNGAPQADIFYHYKTALHRAYADDTVAWENEERIRKGKPIYTPEEYTERVAWFLSRIPYKLFKCRFHSFVVYFSNLQRLGWVEPTGFEEPSAFQDHYPPGPPRRYFRLTDGGRNASDRQWSNPLLALYGERWGGEENARQHLRELRKKHKYIKPPKR